MYIVTLGAFLVRFEWKVWGFLKHWSYYCQHVTVHLTTDPFLHTIKCLSFN